MDSVFYIVIAAMALIVVLLRFKVMMGISILCGGLVIWLFESRSFPDLWEAAIQAAKIQRNWDLIFCLYFVMCLEVELRTSGSLSGLVKTFRNIFSSNKVTLAVMPAFLGLLPSMGGARFSAPIVEEASQGIAVNAEQKSVINLWFRHIFEFSNPLMPGMILACGIANVTIQDLIIQVGWVTILCFVLGWILLVQPLKIVDKEKATNTTNDRDIDWKSLFLAFGPIIASFLLIVSFGISAAISMGLVVVGFIPIFYAFGRKIPIKNVFLESLDVKLLVNVVLILYFIQLLTITGILDEIVNAFNSSFLPQEVIVAALAFIFGLMTGQSQGYIAVVIPIVALMSPGNILLVATAMVFGLAGQMMTPVHLCILVTVEYFKANMWNVIGRCGFISLVMLICYSAWTYFRYYLF